MTLEIEHVHFLLNLGMRVLVALEAELLNIGWTKLDLDHVSLAWLEAHLSMPRIPNLGPSKKSIPLSRGVYVQDKMGTEHLIEPSSSGDFPTGFFALTFLLSLPFYGLHTLAHLHILGKPEIGPTYIVLFTGTPLVSAAILTSKRHGRCGVNELFGRIIDFKRIAVCRWYAPVVFLGPLIFLLSAGGMFLSVASLPPAMSPLMVLPVAFLLFFLMATGEEVGWMGYAFEPMQARSSALRAALVLGSIWAFWHAPFFVFVMPDPVVAGAQLLMLVGNRVLVAWIFNNTGKSVFAAILFHAMDNTALASLPNVNAITPWGTVTHCGLTLVAAGVVTLLWGPQTLARYRFIMVPKNWTGS